MQQFSFEIESISPLRVRSPEGITKFTGALNHHCSKVYVISADNEIVYVGSSKQPIRSRLDGALKVKGDRGYRGYPWKNSQQKLTLDVWLFSNYELLKGSRCMNAETIEAEVVFLIRLNTGNWPKHQAEIHFHHALEEHKQIASKIYQTISDRAHQ
jgi:hypothetical protein